MQNNSLITDGKNALKSYWNRPGGKIGTIIAAVLAASLGWKIWESVVPKIIQMLDDTTEVALGLTKATITMAICAFVVGGIGYALMSPRFRAGIVAVWEKIFINSWLNWFIRTNPKEIAQGRIDEFEEEREVFNRKVGEIQGRYADTEAEIKKIDATIAKLEKQAPLASSKGQLALIRQERGLNEQWREKLLPLRDSLKQVIEACNKIYENSGYQLEEMKMQFTYQVRMFESTNKAASALKTAFSMFSGKGAKTKMGEEALLYMEQRIADNIGNMRNDMKNINKFVEGIDLQNRVYEADGMEMLKSLDPEAYKKFEIEDENGNIPITIPMQLNPQTNKYQSLIKL